MKTTLLETVDRPVMRYQGAKFRLAPLDSGFLSPASDLR